MTRDDYNNTVKNGGQRLRGRADEGEAVGAIDEEQNNLGGKKGGPGRATLSFYERTRVYIECFYAYKYYTKTHHNGYQRKLHTDGTLME